MVKVQSEVQNCRDVLLERMTCKQRLGKEEQKLIKGKRTQAQASINATGLWPKGHGDETRAQSGRGRVPVDTGGRGAWSQMWDPRPLIVV